MSEQEDALRPQLRMEAEAGATLNELTRELVKYKGPLSANEYEELWLYCWALTRREGMRSVCGGSGGLGSGRRRRHELGPRTKPARSGNPSHAHCLLGNVLVLSQTRSGSEPPKRAASIEAESS